VHRRPLIHPLVTLLAILFLVEFMGIAGAVLAVPVAAAAQIARREVLALRRCVPGGTDTSLRGFDRISFRRAFAGGLAAGGPRLAALEPRPPAAATGHA
jgi:hypothetical protein